MNAVRYTGVRGKATDASVKIAEKVQKYFIQSLHEETQAEFSKENRDVWTKIYQGELRSFFEVARSASPEALVHAFTTLGEQGYAFGGMHTGIDSYGRDYHTVLKAFATLFDIDEDNPSTLVDRLQKAHFDFGIIPPTDPFWTWGIDTTQGLVHYRFVYSLYQAFRSKQLSNGPLLEIGGGMGHAAYFGHQLGIKDWTLVDLPLSNLISSYYLMLALGEDSVSLGWSDKNQAVKIIPYYEFPSLPQDKYDLVVCQDAMVEIDHSITSKYIQNFPRLCKGKFLSINHEGFEPYTVTNMCKDYQLVSKTPYILRNDYFEEVYSL